MKRRRDAEGYIIEHQGSPALLDNIEDVQPITDFISRRARRSSGGVTRR